MIKRALYWAPQRAKLLGCKSLCLPHLEYAAATWDLSNKGEIADLEQVQNPAARFITGIKSTRGIGDAMGKFDLPPLQQRSQQERLRLLMRILDKEDTYPALMKSYDEIMTSPDNFIKT